MVTQQLNNHVHQGIAKVKKDLSILEGAGSARLSRLGANVNQAAEDFNGWVGDGVSQLREGLDNLTGNAKASVNRYTAEVKKDVGHGLGRYNARIQEIADKVPGNFSYKVDRYPWVAVSFTLVIGLFLGFLLKPSRRPLE